MTNGDEQNILDCWPEHTEPLIAINDESNFIRHDGSREGAVLSLESLVSSYHSTVIDRESLELIQVLRLHHAVDYTKSATGSAALMRSLVRPSVDLQYIRSRQESLMEIASDDKLRQALENAVHEFCNAEPALYKFFNKGLYALFPYLDLKKARKAAVDVAEAARAVPKAESPYLRALISRFESYGRSSIRRMMKGPIYKTFGGLKSGKEVGLFTPKQKFVPRRFSQWIFAGPAVASVPYVFASMGFGQSISPLLTSIGLGWTGIYVLYGLFFKPVRDTESFIEPLRAECVSDDAFARSVDAFAMIDELLSFHEFAKRFPHPTTLPEISDENRHFFEATGLKSPVLAMENPDFVPNDVHMNGARLTFVSGPNSGGKTTLCKSIVQNQLLAQAGGYVAAEKASINIADMISYQAPKFDGLQDEEGRFGTELARTRDIFYSTGPKSLVILDELAEGTTYEERLKTSFGIMSDFHTIGNNTVLVTHNHSLVDRFVEEKKGQALMAQFEGEEPTYKIILGISRVSHAERIAGKINFSAEDRRRYMEKKGYFRQTKGNIENRGSDATRER